LLLGQVSKRWWGHKKGLPYEDFLVQQSFLYENSSTVEPRAYFC
jgi:hypothetical protein